MVVKRVCQCCVDGSKEGKEGKGRMKTKGERRSSVKEKDEG